MLAAVIGLATWYERDFGRQGVRLWEVRAIFEAVVLGEDEGLRDLAAARKNLREELVPKCADDKPDLGIIHYIPI